MKLVDPADMPFSNEPKQSVADTDPVKGLIRYGHSHDGGGHPFWSIVTLLFILPRLRLIAS